MMALCDCDRLIFPLPLDIPSGLTHLPRQIGLFGDFRQAMLADIRDFPALADWRAREEDDFGLMILDWWAYVADVLGFYTAEHVNELYLGTASREDSLRRIVGLIGYRPRPALAATATLAALVDGADLSTAPARARFISDALDEQPPQDFELEAETQLDPRLNDWTVGPIPTGLYEPERLLLDPATRNFAEGAVAVIDVAGNRAVFYVQTLEQETALDGRAYLRMTVEDSSVLPPGPADIGQVRLWTLAQNVPIAAITGSSVTLHGLYPQIRKGSLVVVEEDETNLSWFTVNASAFGRAELVPEDTSGTVALPAVSTATTVLTLSGSPSATPEESRLHFGRLRGARPISPALHELTLADLQPQAKLVGPNDVPEVDPPGAVLLKGARDRGAHLPSDLHVDPDSGGTTLTPDGSALPFEAPLRTPVKVHGNLLTVTRGKTVEETLGSGQGSLDFQSFTLAKKPLTYVSDPAAPKGRRSSLRVWVDNIEWREVESLFLASPDERVFTVDLDAEGQATITFGGGGFGLPASLGVQNVFARYRFGAGEPPPPANAIKQIASPVPGLRRVFNPRPAFGGGPGDGPEDLRHVAAASAATFDRAVSASDFAVLARDFGALNAIAVTEWVPDRVREGVVVTAIFEGTPTPEITAALQQHLTAKAAETTPIRVIAADPEPGVLELTYEVAADADPARVAEAIEFGLLDEFRGLLAPRNALIGGPLFRSAILGAAAKATGLDRIVSLLLDGATCPLTIPLEAHDYFAPDLVLVEAAS